MAEKSAASRDGSEAAPEVASPRDLFTACKSKEEKLKKLSRETVVLRGAMDYLFEHHPLFVESRFAEDERVRKRIEGRYPWDFSIVLPAKSKKSVAARKYRKLLNCLRKLGDPELRVLCIARWLKQEEVCEPEGLLPRELVKRLVRKFAAREGLSWRRLHHWRLVAIWLPYFEALLAARRKIPKTNRTKDALLTQGFESPAIAAAHGKRRPVPAITAWLEENTRIDARTLETAYSSIESWRRRRRREFD